MNWDSFKKKFHYSWHSRIKPFIESKECDAIFTALKAKAQSGEKIAPTSHNTFKAFMLPLDTVKVVILGGSPYDGFIDGVPVANGLLLDCSSIQKPSYELSNFHRGIEIEVYNGLSLHYKDLFTIEHLTKQGVMMLNSALTVEQFGTHEDLWRPFTKHVLKILEDLDVPILMMGELAQSFTSQFDSEYRLFHVDEPAGVPEEWDTSGVFRELDNQLEEAKEETIMWLNLDVPY